MPILYESTEPTVRVYGQKLRLSPDFSFGSFAAGLVTGFIVLPIVLPILGFQLTKRYGPPAK